MWIAVGCVGGVGAVGRFALDALIGARERRGFPLGTLVVNLSGTLLLGLLVGLGAKGNLLLLAGVAAIGSYTTFSTWMLETDRLAEEAAFRAAFLNVSVSMILGFGAALLGRVIGLQL